MSMSTPLGYDVRVTDTSLRDGSHHLRHQVTVEHVRRLVGALDRANVPVVEVSHGDGLGGSSLTYGRSLVDERTLIAEAVASASHAKIACLLLPGVGTCEDIRVVADLGASVIRIATHCTEADVSVQHFGVARTVGLETVGFLMMSHTHSPEGLAAQARIMADAGCQCVYVVDSAGAMVLDHVVDRVEAVVAELGSDATVGFHGHENLALGVANSILAVRAGAVQIDGSVRRLGAGAGNTPTEAFVAAATKVGIRTGIDPLEMFDIAEDIVGPMLDEAPSLSRLALVMGYAGVYSSFLKHAYRAGEQFGVSAAEILLLCGERKLVGGQEDQINEIAAHLVAARQPQEVPA